MTEGRLSTFFGRVKGDPYAIMNVKKGRVEVPEFDFMHEVELPPDHFFSYRLAMPRFDTLRVSLEVLQGGEMDLLVMNDYNYGLYVRREPFIYIVSGSILRITKIENIFIAQENGVYHIVLDNTFYPENGARPDPQNNGGKIKVRITTKTHAVVQEDLQAPMRL